MRREGGLRGGSIAESQAFEAGCSPQAIAKDRRVPHVVIHLFEVRQLLLARARERQRTRHHRHVRWQSIVGTPNQKVVLIMRPHTHGKLSNQDAPSHLSPEQRRSSRGQF